MELEGIYVPNITPFTRKGDISFHALEGLIEFLLEANVSGLVVNASTGEAPLLSQEERVDLISFVREKVAGRGAVIAGTGVVGTRETISLTSDALEAGADAALVATPYFFRPKEEEIYKHFASLLSSVEIPIILYNVPKFTGYSVSPKVVDQIADDCNNLIGIKDSSSNPGNMAENLRLFGHKISVLSGAADMTLPTLAMGGKGAILAVANAIPKTCVQLYKASVEGLLKKAGRLQLKVSYVNKVLVREHPQVAAIKSVLKILGHSAGMPRRPLLPLSVDEERKVVEEFRLFERY